MIHTRGNISGGEKKTTAVKMEVESDFCCNKEFASESLEMHVDGVDENDNYNCIEKKNTQQPVDAAPVNLGFDEEKVVEIENALSNRDRNARQRQTTLSEYFSALPTGTQAVKLERDDVSEKVVTEYFPASPTETSTDKLARGDAAENLVPEHFSVKLERDDTSEKMIHFPQLLRQLLSARVVLDRLPENPVAARAPTSETGVQRYCFKCKIFSVDYARVTAPKACPACRTTLVYVCNKCNDSHYYAYNCCRRHESRCKGVKTGQLEDIVVMRCADCTFTTSRRTVMECHTMYVGHRLLEGEAMENPPAIMESRVKETRRKGSEGKKKHTGHRSEFIVMQSDIDFSKARKRYCPTCARVVVSSNTAKNDETCEICDTTLLFQCGKCAQRYVKYSAILYHLKTTCYPSLYRCTKCEHTARLWYIMRRHLKECQNWLSFERKIPDCDANGKFHCEHCSYGSVYKHHVKRHMKTVHRKLLA